MTNQGTAGPGGEQLTLDLGVVPRAESRPSRWWTARTWWTIARLVLAGVAAVVFAGAAMSLVPYRSSIAGVAIVVTGSVTPAHRGLTVDSSLGSLQFRDVTALPIGLHVAPRIDVAAVRAATSGGASFTSRARTDLSAQIPHLIWHFGFLLVVGMALGALVGSVLVEGFAALLSVTPPWRRLDRGKRVVRTGARVATVTVVVAAATAATLAASYQAQWYQQYTVTGLLADVAAAPDQLAALDARDSGAADKIRAVLRLQDALTQPPVDRSAPPTAYNVLLISDVHRRNIYPYLQQYIDANDVKLIVNTGDETLVGNTAELTPDYVSAISAITARTPMLWVKGNHDSAAVATAMDAIPGVTVLDGQIVTALGLQVYGTADPRTYGAPGDAGSDAPAAVTRIETAAASDALAGLNRSTYLDLLMAHEPIEADAIAGTLGPSVRAQASGHVHHQNAESDLQTSGRDDIRLVEGSTGLGGLLADAGDPMEFSILSIAANCQYTRIVRYQLADPALPADTQTTAFGNSSSFVVHYFEQQSTTTNRTCSASSGISKPVEASSTNLRTLADWDAAGANSQPMGTAVSTPAPAVSADETGDAHVQDNTSSSASDPGSNPAQPTS